MSNLSPELKTQLISMTTAYCSSCFKVYESLDDDFLIGEGLDLEKDSLKDYLPIDRLINHYTLVLTQFRNFLISTPSRLTADERNAILSIAQDKISSFCKNPSSEEVINFKEQFEKALNDLFPSSQKKQSGLDRHGLFNSNDTAKKARHEKPTQRDRREAWTAESSESAQAVVS